MHKKEYIPAALVEVGGDLSVAEVIGRHQGTKRTRVGEALESFHFKVS